MLFSGEDFRNMITDIRQYFLHLNNYKIGMLDVFKHIVFVFTDRGGMLFDIEREIKDLF